MDNTYRLKAAIPAVVQEFGKINTLFNNTRIQRRSPSVSFSEQVSGMMSLIQI
ncbi:hypothetical protein [Peribacillus sp. SCS-155]|uniref:hypothetical protein n=1 Tax=Peribacillus sedimenti TaxID=3115297 RepID=UPI0039057708